jgi:two-component system, OmpR family, sensor kinase
MSYGSELSRWRKVRRLPGRIPLRIKLITAVLALVAIALGVISVTSISVLRAHLLGPYDATLELARNQHAAGHAVQQCLSNPGPGCPENDEMGTTVDWVPTSGDPQHVALAVQGGFGGARFGGAPSQPETIPGPYIPPSPAAQSWVASLGSEPVTVSAEAGDGRWRVLAIPAVVTTFNGQTATGTIVLGLDVTTVYDTLGALASIDLIVSAIVIVALAVVGVAIVRTSLRPLTDIELTAGAIAAGDLSQRVPDRDPRTEVGRLGRSLNAMLAQVEAAFHAREDSEAAAVRSEERMRRFVADASHELRTPLTAIRGYAEYYRQRGGVGNGAHHPQHTATGMELEQIDGSQLSKPDMDRIMQRVEQESARMGVLVEDMLLLARLDQQRPLERRPVDLLTLAVDAVQDARMIAPRRDIELTAGHGAAFLVLGDEARLRQVITNLMSNALTHTPDGTPVDIRIHTEGPNGHLQMPSVTLEVADHGAGLPPEQAERVFERFYRADRARARKTGGAGLGLAIVDALVAAHGGVVGVETAPSRGATFWFALPLAAEAV